MNSKLYQKYLSLKIEDSEFCYLFKSKNCYFFIADDAQKVSSILDLHLENLNSVIMKCQFSAASYNKNITKLKEANIKFKEILLPNEIFNSDLENCLNSNKYNELIFNFLNVNIEDLSISQAYDLLKSLQKKFINFKIK